MKDVHINDVLVAEHLAEMVYPEPEPEPEPEQVRTLQAKPYSEDSPCVLTHRWSLGAGLICYIVKPACDIGPGPKGPQKVVLSHRWSLGTG